MRSRLILLAIATFTAGIVFLFPARVAYNLFAPEAIRLSAISGTVWHGRAREGEFNSLYLRNLEWEFQPLSLLRASLGFAARVEPAGGFLTTDLELSPSGTVTFTNLDGGVAISALQTVAPLPGIDGAVRLAFSELSVENGLPTVANGTVDVTRLVARGLSPAPLGDFQAQLASSDEGITGSVEDRDGVLDIAGSLRVSPDRTYSLTGLVAAKPGAPSSVTEQLKFLGSPNERGQREFRFEGQL